MPRAGLFVCVALTFACSDDLTAVEGSEGGSTSTPGETGDGDGDPEPQSECGNGIVEPGEDCEPADSYCDECSDDCRFDPMPANEWSVARELWFDLDSESIAIAPSGLVYSRGVTMDGDPWLLAVTPDGGVTLELGPAEHGFGEIESFAVGPADDVALIGGTGSGQRIRRMLADGSFEAPIAAQWGFYPGVVALTEHGIAMLADGGYVQSYAFDGTPTWVSDDAWSAIGNVDGRLVLIDVSNRVVEFVAGDGTDARRWEELWYPSFSNLRVASSSPVLVGAGGDGGSAVVSVLSLWTGEYLEESLASGLDGLEAGPQAFALDATADAWPIARWSVCYAAGPIGCSDESTGVGGPGDPNAIEVHDCDYTRSLRIGPDGGVYLLSFPPDGIGQLVRRQTLR
jgi:hypothetical protein